MCRFRESVECHWVLLVISVRHRQDEQVGVSSLAQYCELWSLVGQACQTGRFSVLAQRRWGPGYLDGQFVCHLLSHPGQIAIQFLHDKNQAFVVKLTGPWRVLGLFRIALQRPADHCEIFLLANSQRWYSYEMTGLEVYAVITCCGVLTAQ